MSDIGNKEVMARNITKYMDKNGETRKEISAMLGVPYTTVSNWLNANSYPRIDKIEKLAKHWGIQKSDLIEDKSAKAAEEARTEAEERIVEAYRNAPPEVKAIIDRILAE